MMSKQRQTAEKGAKKAAIEKLAKSGKRSVQQIVDALAERDMEVSYGHVSQVVKAYREAAQHASNGAANGAGGQPPAAAEQQDYEEGVEAACRAMAFISACGGSEQAKRLLDRVSPGA